MKLLAWRSVMEHISLKELIDRYEQAKNTVYRRLNNVMQEQVHQELTTDQFTTLRFIFFHQPCTSSDIAQEFTIGKSAVTAQVNRLVERGLLQRKRDEKDRRVIYLSLSDEGEKLVNDALTKLYEVLGEILSNFHKEEVEAFIKSYERLAVILEKKY